VFALGLAGKEQLSNALAQQLGGLSTSSPAASPATPVASASTTTTSAPLGNRFRLSTELRKSLISGCADPELEAEFSTFVAKLSEKNYFGGAEPGSEEYKIRLEKAK